MKRDFIKAAVKEDPNALRFEAVDHGLPERAKKTFERLKRQLRKQTSKIRRPAGPDAPGGESPEGRMTVYLDGYREFRQRQERVVFEFRFCVDGVPVAADRTEFFMTPDGKRYKMPEDEGRVKDGLSKDKRKKNQSAVKIGRRKKSAKKKRE